VSSEALERAQSLSRTLRDIERGLPTVRLSPTEAGIALALLAEVGRLERERDGARKSLWSERGLMLDAAKREQRLREALDAAAEKLDVLRRMAVNSRTAPNVFESIADVAAWARDDARAALVDESAAALPEQAYYADAEGCFPEAAAATLAEPGRRDASTPAVGTGEASLPGSASAAADAMDERAAALVAYGESLPDGVTTEAFAEAANLRHEARRLRASAAADEPGETP
jgi:hypothetical protein